ncbi:MAG: tetratricopeptide repeat protein [Gammaproteobacteria bacterium]
MSQARQPRLLFYLIALSMPLLLLGLVEVLLRMTGVGARESLFVPAPVAGYMQPNDQVIQRFFANPRSAPDVSIDTSFFLAEKAPGSIRVVVQGGSSAAGFPYGKWASPAGMLQQRLERAFPGRMVEVIGTAMSAVNSYTLLDFADEIADLDPDAVLIYAGHNEFLGVLGAGSAYSSSLSPELTRLLMSVRRIHLVESGFRLYGSLMPAPDQRSGTLMSRVARERRIASDSELYRIAGEQFESNLQRLLQIYQSHGIPVLIGTLAANEKDQPPFLSARLPPEQAAAWEMLRDEAVARLESEEPREALGVTENLVEMTPDNAEAWYLQGQARLAIGEPGAAQIDFRKAKDLDQLRFRAPESFNQIIVELSRDDGIFLVDVQAAMAARSASGLIGNELMLEHLHPNVDGYFVLADAMFEVLMANQILGDPDRSIDSELARREIPVTAIDRLAGEYRVGRLKLDWPFLNEKQAFELPAADNDIERLAQAWFEGKLTWKAAMDQALAIYQRDGDASESVRVGWNLAAAFPFDPEAASLAGTLMLRANQPRRALPLLHRAARQEPRNTRYLMGLAQGFYQSGQTAESIQVLERVLVLAPDHPRAPMFLDKLKQEAAGPE